MFQVASEPIQPPADQHVELPPLGVGQQAIQFWPSSPRSRHADVHVLLRCPLARLDIMAKLQKLIVDRLVDGRNTSVDSGAHYLPPVPECGDRASSALPQKRVSPTLNSLQQKISMTNHTRI